MRTISVIIPVYRAEDYLCKCIDSILAQTHHDFELILVDDGSPDRSGEICDEYAKRDSRIVVIHKENGGVSSARNAGLDIATGEYVVFVDSDDWIDQNFFKDAIAACEENNLDMYLSGFTRVLPNGKHQDSIIKKDIICLATELPQDVFADMLEKNYSASSTTKLIRKELIGDSRFDTKMNFGEDLKFVFHLLEQPARIQAVSNVVYYYRVGHTSLTASSNLRKCQSTAQTYQILYDETVKRGYSTGEYITFLDKRCYSDLLYSEQLILRSQASFAEKSKMLRTLLRIARFIPRMKNKALIRHLRLYGVFSELLLLRNRK